MFETIRAKLLLILFFFISITLITSVISFSYITRNKDNLSDIKERVETTYILLLEDIMVTRDFFENETINSDFFETGQSEYLSKHYKICYDIDSAFNKLFTSQRKYDFELDKDISLLKTDFNRYKISIDEIIKEIQVRGFKDFGVEGKMREYAHQLEEQANEIGIESILQLRRHEKDFIIRQEDQYILKFNNLLKQVKTELITSQKVSKLKKDLTIEILDNYAGQFLLLADHEKRIGLKNQQGMKKEIDETTHKMGKSFASLVNIATLKEKVALKRIMMVFMVFGLFFIVASTIAALLVSKRVSKTIISLKEKITEFVESNFTKRTILPRINSKYEVDILANNFSIMEQHIVNQVTNLKQTNKELERLIYSASHDLKGPLSTLKGLINLATMENKDPVTLKYFSMIDRSWGKLNTIVDELRTVSEIKTDEIKPENIKVEELLNIVLNEIRLQINTPFDISNEITFKDNVYSDPKLIKSILYQLIENAIKYSNKNVKPAIKISVSQESNKLKIVVSDNGIGIKREFHDKIYEMFFRGTTNPTGSGLGLFIVQNSVTKLKGTITVESDEGKGAIFTILFPISIKQNNGREFPINENRILISENA